MMVHDDNDKKLRFFSKCFYSPGELARVRQICRDNGTSLILPYDQFIEHDCRHLEADSDSGNPNYIMKLGIENLYTAVAVHYGVSMRYWSKTNGKIPLIVKINGKTSIPSESMALSTHTSYVEDAVKIGAVGIGYTMYYGSPRQDEDLQQLADVRVECERYGMPLIVWAYPRGEAIEAKGGRDSSYALESAARMAMEMGATVIKSNLPKPAPEDFTGNTKVPKYYRELEKELQNMDTEKSVQERANRIVRATQGIPVLFSGGSEIGDDDLLKKAKVCVKAGCQGFIFGRNMWKRKPDEAGRITKELIKILDSAE